MANELTIKSMLKSLGAVTIGRLHNALGQQGGDYNNFFALLTKMERDGDIRFLQISIENTRGTKVELTH